MLGWRRSAALAPAWMGELPCSEAVPDREPGSSAGWGRLRQVVHGTGWSSFRSATSCSNAREMGGDGPARSGDNMAGQAASLSMCEMRCQTPIELSRISKRPDARSRRPGLDPKATRLATPSVRSEVR